MPTPTTIAERLSLGDEPLHRAGSIPADVAPTLGGLPLAAHYPEEHPLPPAPPEPTGGKNQNSLLGWFRALAKVERSGIGEPYSVQHGS